MTTLVASRSSNLKLSAMTVLPLLLFALIFVMAFLEPRFFGTQNLFNVLRNSSFLAILALGQAIVIAMGGMDLSVGAVAAFAGVITSKLMATIGVAFPDLPLLAISVGVAGGVASGAVVGLANGLCVAKLQVSPLIVTLGTLSIVSGSALLLTSGLPIYGLPDQFVTGFGRAYWLGLPSMTVVAILVLALGLFIQQKMIFMKRFLAVGGNLHAARVSGLNVNFYLIGAYTLCSVLSALTGILLTAQIGSGQTNLGGDRLMLLSIAAAVLGGVSLRGGVVRLEGVAIGAIFLTAVANALNMLRIDSKKELVVLGIVLIAAVAADEFAKWRASRV